MSGWEKGIEFTLGYEGGYANNPADRGGETFRGISRKSWPDWSGWSIVDLAKAAWPDRFADVLWRDQCLLEEVKKFYRKNFWEPVHGDELPDKMAAAVFDMAVNSGVGTAARLMQVALNVPVDGNVGPVTVKAAHDAGEAGVVEFMARRAKFLHEIMDRDPGQTVWAMNWFRRLFKLANVVLEG